MLPPFANNYPVFWNEYQSPLKNNTDPKHIAQKHILFASVNGGDVLTIQQIPNTHKPPARTDATRNAAREITSPKFSSGFAVSVIAGDL